MKTLNDYITEKFQVSKDNIRTYAYHPTTKDELIQCIKEKIDKEGLGTEDNPLDLNDIDTSEVIDMSNLFDPSVGKLKELSENGYFVDISSWDVSNVKNMKNMFRNSNFNGNISHWDVSNVEDMYAMFHYSSFSGNISDWDVSKVEDMHWMFRHSKFNGNISGWDVSKVRNMEDMFVDCPIENNPPKWYHE